MSFNFTNFNFVRDNNSNEVQTNKTTLPKNKVGKDKTKDEKNTSSFVKFLFDFRTHGIIGVALIVTSIYLFIISISFFSTYEEDQSLVLNNTISQIAQQPQDVKNIGGATGVSIAHTLYSEWIGLASLVFIFYIGIIGFALMRVVKVNFWSLTFKCLMLSITASVVLGLISYNITSLFHWGGDHGYYINEFLIRYIGVLGAILVSVVLIAIVIYIYMNDLRKLYKAYKTRLEQHKQSIIDAQLEREQTQKSVDDSMKSSLIDENEAQNNEEDYLITNDKDDQDLSNVDDLIDNTIGFTIEDSVAEDDAKEEQVASSNQENKGEATFDAKVADEIEAATDIINDVYDPTAELSKYKFPTIDLLKDREVKVNSVDQQEQEENKERITKTLNDYGIEISHIQATVGPTVTLYEIIPAKGVRIAKIKRLEDDIALSLSALGIRIIAPIPGKGTIGVEVPNKDPQTVSIKTIIASKRFQECKNMELPMALGATISNDVFMADLTKMPHLLVAGATGQGKSVGLNTIIASLLYKKHPAELKFVLVDPKMVELSLYSKLERHYLAKLPDEEEAIITNPEKVVNTLNSLCVEMDNRYSLLKDAGARTILEYNAKFTAKRLNPEKGHRYLPYIVMIVDEFADLIMTAGKEVETPIARIAQKARAVGMHMIIATQRPSTNVITGIIKANFPGRTAFRVSQMVDSKTILDRTGANQLIGRGDMLFSINGDMTRVQCAFIDTDEVENICNHINEQIGYKCAYELPEPITDASEIGGSGVPTDRDTLFEEAARAVVLSQTASTSSLQRRYSIGYNRAGKIMDQMEAAGIVGPSQGGKPRQILVDSLQLERILEQ